MKNQSYIFFLRTLLLMSCCINIFLACPYSHYEEHLIPLEWPVENYYVSIQKQENQEIEYKFGFWSFFIPQLENQNLIKIDKYIGVLQSFQQPELFFIEQGQLLISIETNEKVLMTGYLWFDPTFQAIGHKYLFNAQEQLFKIPIDNYEGKWIFSIITISHQSVTISMSDDNIQINGIELMQEMELKIIIGGGSIKITNYFLEKTYMLQQYRGRLSKIIELQEKELMSQSFLYISKLCSIPPLYQEEQIVFLIQGFQLFDGNAILQKQIQHTGNRFFLSGWIKYDFTLLMGLGAQRQDVLLITSRENYGKSQPQDNILAFQLNTILSGFQVVQLQLRLLQHYYPSLEVFNWNFYDLSLKLEAKKAIQLYQSWHFITFEYGVNQLYQNTMLSELVVFDGISTTNITAQGSILTNSQFYFYIGGNDFVSNLLYAIFYNLKFQFNYDKDQPRDVLNCHFSCKTCNGPLQTNCMSCQNDSNRIFMAEKNQCECLIGYFEFDDKGCTKFQDYFTSVTFDEKEVLNKNRSFCQYGQFEFSNQHGYLICLQCPQESNQNFLCLDCLLNPKSWYLNPVCTKDYISQNFEAQIPFQYTLRSEQDFDLYFLTSNGQLQLQPELKGFCQEPYSEGCFQSKVQHIDHYYYVICKPNYQLIEGKCIQLNPLCANFNDQGQCIEIIEGVYYWEGKYVLCPSNCKKCQFDDLKGRELCLVCQDNLILKDDKCQKCGQFCKTCQNYYDENLNYSYLKCYQCIDDKKYYLSFDGVNCKQNPIKLCLYAFEALKDDLTINTLDLHFTPRNDVENIVVHCGRCSSSVYIINHQLCLYGWFGNYMFSYSQDLCEIQITGDIIQALFRNLINGVFGFGDKHYNFAIDYQFNYKCTTQQFPLYQNKKGFMQFSDGCQFYSENCQTCLTGRTNDIVVCIECKKGFYVEKVSEKCRQCPINLNCRTCIQWNKLYKDDWKKQIRMIYKQLIEEESSQHLFIEYGQSQNIEDYEIVCTSCVSGYDLHNYQCIKSCPSSCIKCEIVNNENKCILCAQNQVGRSMTLFNNECIQCPINCVLCIEKSHQELQSINPLFSNSKYFSKSLTCLKKLDDKNYYFDQDLLMYINCQHFDRCFNEFIISLNLICSENEYKSQANSYLTLQEKLNFYQENIFIDDLFSNQSFYQYENDQFYQLANEKQIKRIIISITSKTQQFCKINREGKIQQRFSQNIFTAIDIEISLIFEKFTEFQLEKNIEFINFKVVNVSGLFLYSNSQNFKSLIITSSFQQSITLSEINISSKSSSPSNFKIIIENITFLQLKNFEIFQFILEDQDYFIQIKNNQGSKILQIFNLTISESSFSSTHFMVINFHEFDSLQIESMIIQAEFFNSSFLLLQGNQNSGIVVIKQAKCQLQLQSSLPFLDSQISQYVEFNQVEFFSSLIINSILLMLNNNVYMTFMNFHHNTLKDDSFCLVNHGNYQGQKISYVFNDISFLENQYHKNSYFSFLKKIQNGLSSINITNFNLNSNILVNQTQEINLKSLNSTLFYIEVDFLILKNLDIQKGYGFPEISILYAQNVEIDQVQIQLGDKFKFLGLHPDLYCQLKFVQNTNFRESIRLYDNQVITINNLSINSVSIYNSPIIYIKSENTNTLTNKEEIIIQEVLAENNLILLTEQQVQSSIILIQTEQEISISFKSMLFKNNIMIQYTQDSKYQSALIFYIDSQFGAFIIQDSFFEGNIMINGTDSINYVNANYVQLKNCTFLSNNIFNFTTIYLHLIWSFQDSVKHYLEDLEQSLPISSTTGNGLIVAQVINISNCHINNSQGTNGAGFRIIVQKQGNITISNVIFSKLKNKFEKLSETGGCLSVDSRESQKLDMLIQNVYAEKIYSRYLGGLLFITPGVEKSIVKLKNVQILDAYSQQGSIVYVDFSIYAKAQQVIILEDFIIFYSNLGMVQYYDEYFKTKISSIENSRLLNNMSLFFIQNADILTIANVRASSQFNQAFLIGNNIVKTQIYQITILDSYLKNYIIWVQPDHNTQSILLIKNVLIKNLSFGEFSFPITCFENSTFQYEKSKFQCPLHNEINKSQLKIKQLNLNQNYSYGSCYFKNVSTKDFITLSLMYFGQLQKKEIIKITGFQIQNVLCKQCQSGLFNFNFVSQSQIVHLTDLFILDSQCGSLGCINLQTLDVNQTRILQISNKIANGNSAFIQNYVCKNNTSLYGVCLYINNFQIQVINSQFSSNQAIYYGGSIYVKGQKQFLLKKSSITENTALVGGGIFIENSQETNYVKLQSQILLNQAQDFGDDLSSIPSQLNIEFGVLNNFLITDSSHKSNSELIDQITIQKGNNSYIFLPSGQQISMYQIFDTHSQTYRKYNKKLRIVAFNTQQERINNLIGSYCLIQSRLLNLSLNNEPNFENQSTNINQVYFSQETQDYNLDNLLLYFNSLLPEDSIYQLQFECNSIQVPIFNDFYPFEIQSFHRNYKLRLNVRPIPCQYGEIINLTDNSCSLCQNDIGFFSIRLNQTKCQIKDDYSTVSVTPAQLNLRQQFWRPYFESSSLSYCFNLPENCLGGWQFGDSSCYVGHLGALCEQCDILNIRGDGKFSVSQKYSCQTCQNNFKNIIFQILVSFWTVISIIISVQESREINSKFQPFIKNQKFSVFQYNTNSAQLLKIFINYFQILSSISQQLSIPIGIVFSINMIGAPLKAVAYSFDCILANFNLELEYSRIIYQLCLPIIYLLFINFLQLFLMKYQVQKYNLGVLITSLIYTFIYLQPPILSSLVEIASFRLISEYKWIAVNVARRFDTHRHIKWIVRFTLPFFIIFGFIIPILIFFKLYKSKYRLHEKMTLQFLGFLYIDYRLKRYYWEIIKIVQKELIVIILTFFDQQIILKFLISSLILFIYIHLNLKFQPYYYNNFNLQDYNSSSICIQSMILGILLQKAEESKLQEITIMSFILIITINFAQVFQLLELIVNSFLRENKYLIIDYLIRICQKHKFFEKILNLENLKAQNQKSKIIKKRFQILKAYLLLQAYQIISFKQNQIGCRFLEIQQSQLSMQLSQKSSKQIDDQLKSIEVQPQANVESKELS